MAQNLASRTIPAVPVVQDTTLASWMQAIHDVVKGLQQTVTPPQVPTGITVTPIGGGNVIQFTRSNATNVRLYHSTSADRSRAVIVDLGSNNGWTDTVGEGGVKKWYWLESVNSTSISALAGPFIGTTLALGTPATISPTAAPSYRQVFDTTLNRLRPVVYDTDRVNAPKLPGQ